jgi:hypothetical protein
MPLSGFGPLCNIHFRWPHDEMGGNWLFRASGVGKSGRQRVREVSSGRHFNEQRVCNIVH